MKGTERLVFTSNMSIEILTGTTVNSITTPEQISQNSCVVLEETTPEQILHLDDIDGIQYSIKSLCLIYTCYFHTKATRACWGNPLTLAQQTRVKEITNSLTYNITLQCISGTRKHK